MVNLDENTIKKYILNVNTFSGQLNNLKLKRLTHKDINFKNIIIKNRTQRKQLVAEQANIAMDTTLAISNLKVQKFQLLTCSYPKDIINKNKELFNMLKNPLKNLASFNNSTKCSLPPQLLLLLPSLGEYQTLEHTIINDMINSSYACESYWTKYFRSFAEFSILNSTLSLIISLVTRGNETEQNCLKIMKETIQESTKLYLDIDQKFDLYYTNYKKYMETEIQKIRIITH